MMLSFREIKQFAQLLDVAERPEAVIFEFEQPVGVVERLLSPGRRDWLHAWERHLSDMPARERGDKANALISRVYTPLALCCSGPRSVRRNFPHSDRVSHYPRGGMRTEGTCQASHYRESRQVRKDGAS
jgi:hypothetical protein